MTSVLFTKKSFERIPGFDVFGVHEAPEGTDRPEGGSQTSSRPGPSKSQNPDLTEREGIPSVRALWWWP